MVDMDKLHQFVGQMLSDLGGAASVGLVRIGEAFGLYKTLHEHGPMTVAELAAAAGVNQRYLREWLSHQAASNYPTYEPATQKFALPPEVRIHLSQAPQRRVHKPSVPQWLSPSRSERKLEARLLDHSTVVAIQGGWVQLVHLGNIAAYVVARIFLAQPLGHASGEF